ncbi:holo-ACP synthase [Alkalihalobacillus sp. AL-G]|uniref:holo-ACP synthase n=1 Tax=Alkalihalobacillus sp. AL-G TaxID=2926399 RepID=UPI00272B105D|nr:holo-ACP synthase [Alkalihalobacillus sp. AL-G]WLD93661.1 holo-ACP synthase [Alkalihalobacillus sp. AL-G]
MIIGTGIDIVEIERIKKTLERQPRIAERILTDLEYKLFRSIPGRQIEFLAGRFAAKEAYAKAIGTGIGGQLSWKDIEVLPDETGKPIIYSDRSWTTFVSISHSKEYAIAQVILESSSR